MTERLRRTDAREDLDRLDAVYQRFASLPVGQSDDASAPAPPPEATSDPWYLGKEVAVRITKFVALCLRTFGAGPAQVYFAMELAALNVFNARDSPLPPPDRDAARKAAYDYYVASLPDVPESNE